MNRKKLTDISVENAKKPASGRIEIWDSEFRGFGLRVADFAHVPIHEQLRRRRWPVGASASPIVCASRRDGHADRPREGRRP